MANILDDTKINGMLGAVSNATSQTTNSIGQIEQWNSLASNINGILEKIMSMKKPTQETMQQIPATAPVGQVMEGKVIPASQQIVVQPAVQPKIEIDNEKLKGKIISYIAQLKNLPDDFQNKTLKEALAMAESNSAMLDGFIPMIASEVKGCIKWI